MKKIAVIISSILLSFTLIFAQNNNGIIDYSVPTEYTIGGIRVQGANHLDHDIIINYSNLRVGQSISVPGDDVSKAIRKLWDTDLFADVAIKIEKKVGVDAFLLFDVKERPRISNYDFEGVKKGEIEELRSRLNLIRGRPYSQNTKVTAVRKVTDYYKNKGFLKSEVWVTEADDPSLKNSVAVNIKVNRGDRIKINEITFDGANSVKTRKLKSTMRNTKENTRIRLGRTKKEKEIAKNRTNKLSLHDELQYLSLSRARDFASQYARIKIFASSKFIDTDFETDKQGVIAYYNSLGYRDAQIVKDSMFVDKNNELNIVMDVEEGLQYRIRNVNWVGNTKYTDNILDRVLAVRKGDVYNNALIEQRLNFDIGGNDVRSLYMDNGHLFFNLITKEVLVGEDSIDLDVVIYEGAEATINKIIIDGNTKTSEHVIRRILRTVPGEKFSRSDIIRSQRELGNTGVFNPEAIAITPIPNPEDGTVDIQYTVEERPSDQLELSAGWGGNRLVGSLGVTFNNFSMKNIFRPETWNPLPSGDLQKFSVRLQSTGVNYQSFTVSFTEPWLGGRKPNSLTASAYRTRQSASTDPVSKIITTGGSIGIGSQWERPDDFTFFNYALDYQRFDLTNWNNSFVINDGKSNNLSLRLSLSHNTKDGFVWIRKGSEFTIGGNFTLPYNKFNNLDYNDPNLSNEDRYRWIEYHKWKFKADYYVPLGKDVTASKFVLRSYFKTGFLGYYNEDVYGTDEANIGSTSPFERFELGGDGLSNFNLYGRDVISARGYDTYTPTQGYPIYNKIGLELRYPFSLNPSSTIFGLAFVEGSNAYQSFKQYNPFELKRSAGLGLRVFLPMFGTLGFDYGIRFDESIEGGQIPKGSDTNGFFDYLGSFGKFNIILGFEPE